MASKKRRYADDTWQDYLVLTFAAIGILAVLVTTVAIGGPLTTAAYNVVHDYYWPPPITSFHYMVTVHEDGASGDITAAGTGSVGK